MDIKLLFRILFAFPKTLYLNFKCFKIKDAIKMPIIIASNTKIRSLEGNVIIKSPVKFKMIRIGFHRIEMMNEHNSNTILDIQKNAKMIFSGSAHIGQGSIISIHKNAILSLGYNFAISANTHINCYNSISIGNDVQFSWDCLVMDSDTHNIYDENKMKINIDKPIYIGNKVWIGCRCTLLKGTYISSNSVIGANSVMSQMFMEENSILAGNPARFIKYLDSWEI